MSGAEVYSGDRAESSRLFVRCKEKSPKILSDFGCSLQSSGGIDGEHSVVEVDWSGLAWKAGCRNRDVIEAVNAADMKMKNVGHCSLVEYLRHNGQTCSLLIKRDQESETKFYWIAFYVSVKGGEPVVAKRVKRSVGTDINNAERVHKALPRWARRTRSSTHYFQYDNTVQIHLVSGQAANRDRYLGFFIRSGAAKPEFTTDDFVLNMHSYQAVSGSFEGTVVAFSSKPQTKGREIQKPTCGCFDRSRSVDEEDETQIDGEACLSGSTSGPLMLSDFPPWMTDSERQILGNSRMFLWTRNDNGTSYVSTVCNDRNSTLYVSSDSKGQACLISTMSELTIFSLETSSSSSSSVYPNLHDVEA